MLKQQHMEFERVIQALIFTTLLKFSTTLLRAGFLFAGRHLIAIGRWTPDVELNWAIALSVPLGVGFAWAANKDKLHSLLRRYNITFRTSYPSEWYSAFVANQRFVILHLSDGRRLYGWPVEWPDQPDKGHFLIDQPEWILAVDERKPLLRVERFLVPAIEVKMVEFLREPDRANQSPGISHDQEQNHGSESTSAGTEPPEHPGQ